MNRDERTMLHDRLAGVESRNPALTAQLAGSHETNRAMVAEIERLAAELARVTARIDWLAEQETVTVERSGDGWRLVVWSGRAMGRSYHAATIPEAIDRARGEMTS